MGSFKVSFDTDNNTGDGFEDIPIEITNANGSMEFKSMSILPRDDSQSLGSISNPWLSIYSNTNYINTNYIKAGGKIIFQSGTNNCIIQYSDNNENEILSIFAEE